MFSVPKAHGRIESSDASGETLTLQRKENWVEVVKEKTSYCQTIQIDVLLYKLANFK
jgi:hypothetical protein